MYTARFQVLYTLCQIFSVSPSSSPDRNYSPGGVNALGRAYPISTLNVAGVNLTEIDCVNALSRAYPISTAHCDKYNAINGKCVNALSRAYPISTKVTYCS